MNIAWWHRFSAPTSRKRERLAGHLRPSQRQPEQSWKTQMAARPGLTATQSIDW